MEEETPLIVLTVRVWRRLPPATPGLIRAISFKPSERRSPLIRRFSPGGRYIHSFP